MVRCRAWLASTFLLTFRIAVCGQEAPSADRRVPVEGLALGINFGPLMTGSPEFYIEYGVKGIFGISIAGGTTYKPARCCDKADDGVDLFEVRSAYIKAGIQIKPRHLATGSKVVPLLQLR